jgi:feruloyl-CoA synthase
VTPGYFGRPDLTAAAFDADAFYRTGDAVALADPADPSAGLVFRGRIAEDFKLASGTFVRVGAVRTRLLSAIPVLSDAVLAGENRDYVCALGWLNAAEARRLLGDEPAADGELIVHGELRKLLARALAELGGAAGSAARVERLVVLASPASLDAGEITDKGYINQRRVLARRAELVDMLYADPVPAGVIVAEGTSLRQASRVFSSRRIILPVEVFGRSGKNRTERGSLYAARCGRQCSIISVSDAEAPGRSTT